MRIWRGLAVAGLVVGLGVVAAGRVEAQRLPGGVRPEHYSLVIAPDLKAATFVGSETIEVVLDAPTNAITLNAAEIEFVSVKAVVERGGERVQMRGFLDIAALAQNDGGVGDDSGVGGLQTAAVTLDAAKEQATYTFAQALPAGRVMLAIEYKGILNDKLRGFYLSKTKARRLWGDAV